MERLLLRHLKPYQQKFYPEHRKVLLQFLLPVHKARSCLQAEHSAVQAVFLYLCSVLHPLSQPLHPQSEDKRKNKSSYKRYHDHNDSINQIA
mgnify:CR=1 FL=1